MILALKEFKGDVICVPLIHAFARLARLVTLLIDLLSLLSSFTRLIRLLPELFCSTYLRLSLKLLLFHCRELALLQNNSSYRISTVLLFVFDRIYETTSQILPLNEKWLTEL